MVEQLVGPAIGLFVFLAVVVAGIIAYRMRKSALNPPLTREQVTANLEAELAEINKSLEG